MKKYLLVVSLFFFCGQSIFAQAVGDFRTRQSGNWNIGDTWEEVTSVGPVVWTNTINTPSGAAGEITLVASHTVTIPAGLTINLLSGVNLINNGTLIIQTSGRNNGKLNVSGTLRANEGSSISGSTTTKLVFLSGGTYEHNYSASAGVIPVANWSTGSNLSIVGYTSNGSAPTGLNQSFYNVTWNCTSMSTTFLDLAGTLNDINGDFNISSTGTGSLSLSDFSPATINIDGDFNISGSSEVYFNYTEVVIINVLGNFINSTSSSTYFADENDLTLNIIGSISLIGTGTYDFGGFTGTANTTVNVGGSFSQTSGSMVATGAGSKTINFNGGATVNFSRTGGSLSGAVNFVITSSTSVDAGNSIFSGDGDFTINAGSMLSTSNTSGITTFSSGTIQVSGTRTYNPGATITYNGSATQSLGNGFPASGVNLTINNTGGGVDMSSDVTISSGRLLTLTEGTLNIGDGNTLTLNGTVSTAAGGISGGSLSNLSIGGTGAFGTLGFVGTNSLNDFTINRTSSGTVTLGNDLTVEGVFTQTAGDLILNGNQLSLAGDFSQAAGSIISSSTSIIDISGAGTLPSPISISGNAQKITLDRASATFNTGSSSITADTLFALSGDFSFSGTALKVANGGYVKRSNGGSFVNPLSSLGTFDIEYDINSALTTGNELPTAIDEINNIIKNGTGVVTLNSNITVNGDLELQNGGFDAATNAIDIKGDLLLNAVPTFENAAFTFSGTTSLTGTEQPTFGDITITGTFNAGTDLAINGNLVNNGTLTAGSGTATFGGTTTISGSNGVSFNNISIAAAGSLTAPSAQALTVNGNFANSGTFSANGGTIIFGGSTAFTGTTPNLHTVQIVGTLNAPSTLVVAGDLTNNGTFTHNNGLLDMTGAGTRTIAGTNALSVYTLNVDGGTINNNNAAVTIADGITIGASTTLDLDGAGSGVVTLLSTASKDAYIDEIPGTSTVLGNLTVQRAIYATDAGDNAYHIVGFPLTGVAVSDIQAEIPVTGTFTGKSTGTGFDNNPSIYAYDEDVNATFTINERYVSFPPSNNTETFNVGEGYHVYTYPGVLPATIDGTGAIYTGNFSQSLSFTGSGVDAGWHALANPYPAPTDWQLWGKTDIEGTTAYVFNSSTGAYIAYDGTSQQLIPQGQGFFVRASAGTAEVTATEATKVVGTTPSYYRVNDQIQRFEIILQTPNYDDVSIVHLNENATDAYEASFDATRLLNSEETISTLSSDGKMLKVNRMAGKSADESCTRSLFINLEQMKNGVNYQLSFKNLVNIVGYTFELVDRYTETTTALTGDELISFSVNNDELSTGASRFELIFEKNQPIATDVQDVSTCASDDAVVSIPATELNTIYYVERNGETVHEIIGNGGALSFIIPNDSLNSGENVFELKASNSICEWVSVDGFTITVDEAIVTDVLLTGSEVCSNSTFANYSISSQMGITYYLLLGDDTLATVTGDGSVIESTIETSVLNSGENEIQVVAEKPDCGQVLLDTNLIIIKDDFEINENIDFYGSTVCEAENATITINTQQNVDYSILLDNQEVNLIIGDGQTHTISVNNELLQQGTNTFNLVGKYNECLEVVFSKEIEIQVYNQMQISGVNDQFVCKGDLMNISLASNSSNATYQLYLGDSLIGSYTTAEFNFIPSLSGVYKLVGLNENGCLSNELNFNVELIELEEPIVIANEDRLESSVVADAYQWYKDGELLAGETSAGITVFESGAYAVEVMNNYCNKISEAYNFDAVVLGVKGISSSSISYYPNPVKDNLHIVFDENELNNLKVTIFTTAGVKMTSFKQVTNDQLLDLSSLKTGIYIIEFSSGSQKFSSRIIKN